MASAQAHTGKRRRGGDDDLDGNVALETHSGSSPKPPPSRLEGSSLYPTCSNEELASAIWSAYRATDATRLLTDLELGTRLSAEHVTAPLSLVDDLARFIQSVMPHWRREFAGGSSKPSPGAPLVLVVAPSAARCAALLKPLAAFRARIFKCFAKHLSLDDQRAVLAGPPVQLAVGTPHRVRQLVELNVLSLARCRVVVLDLEPDVKRYTLLTNPSLASDAALLLREHVLPLVTAAAASPPALPPCQLAAFPGLPVVIEQQLKRAQRPAPAKASFGR